MHGDSYGRLRFALLHLDAEKTQETNFESKLVPWKESNNMLTEVLRQILRAQSPRAEPAEDPAQWEQEGPLAAAPAQPAIQKIKRRLPAGNTDEGSPPKKMKPMTVAEMQWTELATMMLAGVHDGANAACRAAKNAVASTVISKHIGKLFGSFAATNTAVRNGLLRWATGSETIPMDSYIRTFDALAAIPAVQLCSVNQLRMERLLQDRKEESKHGRHGKEDLDHSEEQVPKLSDLDFGCRRFFDALAASPEKRDGKLLREMAQQLGIPYKVNGGSVWYNWRQLNFGRFRKKSEHLQKYGGSSLLTTYGKAQGWTSLLDHIVDRLGGEKKESADDPPKRVIINIDVLGHPWIRRLHLTDEAMAMLGVPREASYMP